MYSLSFIYIYIYMPLEARLQLNCGGQVYTADLTFEAAHTLGNGVAITAGIFLCSYCGTYCLSSLKRSSSYFYC